MLSFCFSLRERFWLFLCCFLLFCSAFLNFFLAFHLQNILISIKYWLFRKYLWHLTTFFIFFMFTNILCLTSSFWIILCFRFFCFWLVKFQFLDFSLIRFALAQSELLHWHSITFFQEHTITCTYNHNNFSNHQHMNFSNEIMLDASQSQMTCLLF